MELYYRCVFRLYEIRVGRFSAKLGHIDAGKEHALTAQGIRALNEVVREVRKKDDRRRKWLALRVFLKPQNLRANLIEPRGFEKRRLTRRYVDVDEHDAGVIRCLSKCRDEHAVEV